MTLSPLAHNLSFQTLFLAKQLLTPYLDVSCEYKQLVYATTKDFLL